MTKIKSFDEFQPLALRTESRIDSVKTNKDLLTAVLSIQIISGEILDHLKKQIYYNNPTKLLENTEVNVQNLAGMVASLYEIAHNLSPDSLEDEIPVHPRVFHGMLGAITETAEASEILLGGVNGKGIDKVHVQEEMVGDYNWYLAILTDALELDYYRGLTNVINKLRVRYPQKYEDSLAANRDLDAERKELEVGLVELDSRKKYNESMGITRE